ncbi:unnamed protein product [Arctia plantaginis]|uniref:DNA mismatch repair proteins mutS family domain-containing protein n=1 Tax=Arctia plantaginis TaxID=874455 RepID=A0A8S1BPH7_ARCPL|nr:unnamed protein product [Arctia plantaginis]
MNVVANEKQKIAKAQAKFTNKFVRKDLSTDVGTASQLELVAPLVPSAGPTCCLLGVLGPTYTVGGIRSLRAAILQPSYNKEFIESRLDAVQDLIENDTGLMVALQDVIKKLSEIDKILFLCMDSANQNIDKIGEAQLNQVLLLKVTMELVPKLVEALSEADSGKLKKMKLDFENSSYNEISDRIKRIIQDDAHLEKGAMGSLQRCFAVKPDINGLLDVARRTYSELIDDIQKIVEQLSETYDLPLRLNQNLLKGFHIVLTLATKNRRTFNEEDLPPIFIQVQNSGASVTMTTEELVVLNQQAKESLNEIQKMSNIVISTLLKDLRPFMPSLYTLCENVAELDVLLAMAQASSIGSYIRPEFNSYMDIRNSVHPLLDYNTQVMPVPNDIFASPEHNFTLITGPNMGGKSIYIKQIAIMQVMAQMKETQHILKGLTSSSLVIIDELCRGTSVEEGTAVAWAVCEELIMSSAFTFFTTHFMYLTRLQELYFNVLNRHTAVTEEDVGTTENPQRRLVYQYKLEPGSTRIEHYGLALAAKTNLPKETVNLAIELAEYIGKETRAIEIGTPLKTDEAALYMLNANIQQDLRKYGITNNSTKELLQKFKEKHLELVERLESLRSKSDNRTNSSFSYSRVGYSVEQTSTDNNSKDCIFKNTGGNYQPSFSNGANIKPPERERSIAEDVDMVDKNYTSVKSSEQLLNSVLNHDGHTMKAIIQNASDLEMIEDSNSSNADLQNINNTNSRNKEESMVSPECRNNINVSLTDHIELENNYNKNNYISPDDNHTYDIDNLSFDSEIADALTQIVDEYSIQNDSKDSAERNSDYELMSIDEELAKETVHEINEELSNEMYSVENIVLTPPLSFRDI